MFEGSCIESVTIPSTVKRVWSHAFGNIETLKTVDFLTTILPENDNPTTETNESIDREAFIGSGHQDGLVINVPWSEGDVKDAPWGAVNVSINYNYDVNN
jgi:hypothetical protein